jgi:hypothetical protein
MRLFLRLNTALPEGTAWLPAAVSMKHQRPVVMKPLQNPGQNR